MKLTSLFVPVLAFSLLAGSSPVLAHAGHGDEFQATGGVNRVEVKTETDALLGIQVAPIEATTDDGGAVLVPVTALVEDNGRQWVFVQYENFYEPVEVTTGATQGELIEVTDGLSLGEQLVTGGSLSLYAESRKTQTEEAVEEVAAGSEAGVEGDAVGEAGAIATTPTDGAVSPDTTKRQDSSESTETAQAPVSEIPESGGLPLKTLVGGGIGLVIVGGAIALALTKRNDQDGAV